MLTSITLPSRNTNHSPNQNSKYMKTHLKLKLLAVALVFPLLVSQQAFAQNATGTLLQTGTGLQPLALR